MVDALQNVFEMVPCVSKRHGRPHELPLTEPALSSTQRKRDRPQPPIIHSTGFANAPEPQESVVLILRSPPSNQHPNPPIPLREPPIQTPADAQSRQL